MIRLSKMADYGIVLLSYCGREQAPVATARSLAEASHLPLPTVAKLLKALSRAGLLVSQRGARGGYTLARPPEAISVVDVIAAIEGPIAVTACSVNAPGLCELEPACPVRGNWQRINQVVVRALQHLTLRDMEQPLPAAVVTGRARRLALVERS